MDNLTRQEKNAMLALWKTGNGAPSQILANYKRPKPHKNTLNSTLKNLEIKGLVSHELIGNSYNYFPLVNKEQFRKNFLDIFIRDFFENSYRDVALFFATEKKISAEDVKKLLELIKSKKTK